MGRRKVIQCLIIFIFMFLMSGCNGFQGSQSIVAKEGIFDLTSWNFDTDGPVRLDGQWRFYWNQLLHPAEATNYEKKDFAIVKVPSDWEKYLIGNEKIHKYGYATYELKVMMKTSRKDLRIRMPYVSSAYKLWIDDELVAMNGDVGKIRKKNTPNPTSEEIDFKPNGEVTTIRIQISNFYYRKSGIINSIFLGTYKQIQRINYFKLAKDLALFGAIFTIGIYNLIIYKKNKTAKYFGIGCICAAIRNVCTGQYFIMYLFPNISWLTVLRLEYLSYYFTFTMFMIFTYYMFPRQFKKGFLKGIALFGTIFSLIVLLAPSFIFTKTLIIFNGFSIMCMLYTVYALIIAVKNREENIVLTITGSVLLIMSVINDILYNYRILNTSQLSSYGLFIFICFQAFMISKNYKEAEKKAQAYEGEKEKHKVSEIMREVMSTLSSTLELNEVINIILDQLRLLVAYDSAVLLLIDNETVKVSALKNFENSEEVLNRVFDLNYIPLLEKIVKNRKGIIINNLKNSGHKVRFLGTKNIASWIGVPIFQEGKVIGALSIQSIEESKYSCKEREIIEAFASQVSVAIRNSSLYSEVKRLAMYDELTGVFNRRTFFEIAEKEYKRAVRYNFPLSIIMIDVDYFKSINDKYGHIIGDKALKNFASEIKGMLRETDIIGRYGGEEFIIVSNVEKENSAMLAERLRKRIENLVITTEEYGNFSITASFGVAELTEKNHEFSEIVVSADKALYEAKNSGRNKIVLR